MPNWCMNNLEIEGNPKQLHKLLKQIEVTKSEAQTEHDVTRFSCNQVIPRPADQEDNWYEWNTANWGSKWDLGDLDFYVDDWEEGIVGMNFSTAWSPIEPVIETLAKSYPKLSFRYQFYESGSDFWGKIDWENGKRILEHGGELSKATCAVRMNLEGDAHHWCNECATSFTCPSTDEDRTIASELEGLCEECKTSLEEVDSTLWEETPVVA